MNSLRFTCALAPLLLFACIGVSDDVAPLVDVADDYLTPAPSVPTPAPGDPGTFFAMEQSPEDLLAQIRAASPVSLKLIGRTSLAFQMRADGDVLAAVKPRATRHPNGWRAEIAAYRVANLLGMDTVPPATAIALSRSRVRASLHPTNRDAWPMIARQLVGDSDGLVPSSAVVWVPVMRNIGVEQRRGEWGPWLQQSGECPEERKQFAGDLAEIIALDYLIGNFDRWSGGNIKGMGDESRLFAHDHNLAFQDVNPRNTRRLLNWLRRVERFPRDFAERLARLDDASLEAELRKEPMHSTHPMLDAEQKQAFMERVEITRSYIGALIAVHGEDAVLSL